MVKIEGGTGQQIGTEGRMAAKDYSLYTLYYLAAGGALNGLFLASDMSLYWVFLHGVFGIAPNEFVPASGIHLGALHVDIALHLSAIQQFGLMACLGAALLWVSSRLDFVDKADDHFKVYLGGAGLYAVLSGIVFAADQMRISIEANPTLIGVFANIPLSVVAFPGLMIEYSFGFVCTSIFLAGLLSIPRGVIYLTSSHGLTGAWQKGKRAGMFDPDAVERGLGQKASSNAQARTWLKKAVDLKNEVEAEARRKQAEADRLAREINDDTERLQTEAEIAAKLAHIEALSIEIDEMRKFQKGQK